MVSQLIVGLNSFGALDEADTYHDDSPNGSEWGFAGSDDKVRAMIEAWRQLSRCPYAGTATDGNVVDTVAIGDAPGTGYATGEIVTVDDGTGLAARVEVSAQTGGVPSSVQLIDAGFYTTDPTLDESTTTSETTGGGTGLTLDLTMRPRSLLFPRTGLTGVDGEELSSTEYPQILKDAQFALALAILLDPGLATTTSTGSNDKRYKAGSVELERFRPERGKRFPDHVSELLAPLLGINSRLSPYSNTSGQESSFGPEATWGLTKGYS